MVDFPAFPPFPVSSFEAPVDSPAVDPDAGEFVTVCFNTVWLPYVIGCLKQLQNEATWRAADAGEMALILQRVGMLINQFVEGCPMYGPGFIQMYGADTPPTGWLNCDGAAVSRTDFAALFAVIGTIFGDGDFTTTFNLPDMRGRAPIDFGNGTGLSPRTLGVGGGAENHALSVSELANHSHVDSGHAHAEGIAAPSIVVGGLETPQAVAVPGVGVTGSGNANLSSTGSGSAHNNMQPFLAVNFVIKT
jgi:microcystin-dependent protein